MASKYQPAKRWTSRDHLCYTMLRPLFCGGTRFNTTSKLHPWVGLLSASCFHIAYNNTKIKKCPPMVAPTTTSIQHALSQALWVHTELRPKSILSSLESTRSRALMKLSYPWNPRADSSGWVAVKEEMVVSYPQRIPFVGILSSSATPVYLTQCIEYQFILFEMTRLKHKNQRLLPHKKPPLFCGHPGQSTTNTSPGQIY